MIEGPAVVGVPLASLYALVCTHGGDVMRPCELPGDYDTSVIESLARGYRRERLCSQPVCASHQEYMCTYLRLAIDDFSAIVQLRFTLSSTVPRPLCYSKTFHGSTVCSLSRLASIATSAGI